MTTNVRIENASSVKHEGVSVIIEVWEKRYNGYPDILIETHELLYPAQLVERFVWDTRYIVVKQKKINT
jgi:hypothetical protein